MTAEDNISIEFDLNDDIMEEDRRRLSLLNDPNYGTVLSFLQKFQSALDLPNYSLQRLEDHLTKYRERVPSRLIDFHFILLKKLSLAKNTQREKFDSIISRFASRFDLNDADHLTTTGYLQAEINTKIRVLKNLLESQFDSNQTFKNTLIDKSAREIKSTPLGRDRFGVSYWLFMDTECFVRLFREDIDTNRTWSNVAKNRDELENFIKLLVTDLVVREKFSNWNIDYEPFSSLSPSNEFENYYSSFRIHVKEQEERETELAPNKDVEPDQSMEKKRGRPKSSTTKLINNEKYRIKTESNQEAEKISTVFTEDEKFIISKKQKRGRPRISVTLLKKKIKQINVEMKEEERKLEPISSDDEKFDKPIKKRRGRPRRSRKPLTTENNSVDVEIKEEKKEIELTPNPNETTDVLNKKQSESTTTQMKTNIKQVQLLLNEDINLDESTKKKRGRPRKSINNEKSQIKLETKTDPNEEVITPNRRGRKHKIIREENTNTNNNNNSKVDENEQQHEEANVNNESFSLRRSSRPRKTPTIDPIYILNSKTLSKIPMSRKKRSLNGKTKGSNDFSTTTNSKYVRERRRRKTTSRRTINNDYYLSSTSSDEYMDYRSEDEYNSDDYLPNTSDIEYDDNFFALDDDINTTGEELRTAKTAQESTIIIACKICFQSDHPEVLLLCDDCDDAYHLECLSPALLSIPDGDWFCPLCEHIRLSNHLIEKLKELLLNFKYLENKRAEYELRRSIGRKIKVKEYTSDESLTASESEPENLEHNLNDEDSILSISQVNENSNISSSHIDDSNKNISQRGRYRRTRFDMNKMLNDDDDDDDDDDESNDKSDIDDNDDEYVEGPTPITNFHLQIPKKMTRLLNPRNRSMPRNEQRTKLKPIVPRLYHTSTNLREKQGSIMIYTNGDMNSYQIKPIMSHSNQALKIVRRWNDVQRRNKLRRSNEKSLNETISDCADENSVFCPDETSPLRSNDSQSNSDMKDDDCTIIRSKTTLAQPSNLLPIHKNSANKMLTKNEVNFDRLTRDIQYAVSEANSLSRASKAVDQQHVKRTQKTNFSPYLTKISLRPLPLLLPKPTGIGYKIFKSKDLPNSTSTTTDLSNIILTPSSSSSLLDTNDEQSTSMIHT